MERLSCGKVNRGRDGLLGRIMSDEEERWWNFRRRVGGKRVYWMI